jgi:hypothetical protein
MGLQFPQFGPGQRDGQNQWQLEMHNVGVAFEVLENGKSAPQGWTKYVLRT